MKITVKNIQYDLDGLFGFDEYSNGGTKEEVLAKLPTSQEIDVEFSNDDYVPGVIQKHLEEITGWLVVGFDYKISGEVKVWKQKKRLFEIIQNKLENL